MTQDNNRGPPGPTFFTLGRSATENHQAERNRRKAQGGEVQNASPQGRHEKPVDEIPG